jgi:D-alanyl-lipoteichoic acid acyltransferase DltB (MBOAT superfamily)
VIDVYLGKQKAERHFGVYALYVSYFPQLVAGPIERPQKLLPQIKATRVFDYGQATYGLKLMALGYFKKLVIAASAAKYADLVYADVGGFTGFALVLATGLFAVQIYCDFSGYSDIAIGASKMMGIDLTTNFKLPYFACSFKEFWTRWHISLSSWFRDYVYIPVGGGRNGLWKRRRNVMITFLLSGLWHGASWTFVIWGGLHGFYLLAEDAIRKITKNGSGGGGSFLYVRRSPSLR